MLFTRSLTQEISQREFSARSKLSGEIFLVVGEVFYEERKKFHLKYILRREEIFHYWAPEFKALLKTGQ